ncbi:MAG: 23S rRNA (adenine(2503)-C(2))-methyltransferase RlmN [Dictyoglomus sp.]|nr:23S rRNA (adenine(2503)-C(2))-methyltransferase RlmN [Dictyoglomus sp.]MCX7942567.1 23S rRNA (adenine(2503)-C(2))-methyltransferase RlmN [Dictyoglomaceae bacterium]MDW8188805.1 23S rRNA (adenine(2503)-C(2))-methyltransferase RlmN [Dictyoglomus sp.]
MKNNLLSLEVKELNQYFSELGEPDYRVSQVMDWIYKKLVFDFSEMTNLPIKLRKKLKEDFYIYIPKILDKIEEDNTTKFLFQLEDNEIIEAVLIIHKNRKTLCVSTQVGCPFKCKFCATGLVDFRRNLSSGEILAQILWCKKFLMERGENLNNVVYMGMGEPLANYEEVVKSIKILNSPLSIGMGARHISLSTVGLVPQIYRLSEENIPITLAISLHAPENELRNILIPINKKYPLEELLPACWHYSEKTGRRISFEYVLLERVNDSLEMAEKLVNLLKGKPAHVNLIPWNEVPEFSWKRPSILRIKKFERYLKENNINVTLRISRGEKIKAGCGQLRGRFIWREKYEKI